MSSLRLRINICTKEFVRSVMQISIKQGEIKGIECVSKLTGLKYYSFLGIPYAEPPINLRRFQAPRPHAGWDGVLDATKRPNICVQFDRLRTKQVIGDEDCLYLNVHTPQNPKEIKKLKPVMVFVHGGGFSTGNGAMYGADYLMNHDIVLVTFNYRLHVLGFLNLGIPECPGNVGLKDQVLAFQWIRDNIKAFGGDPKNVTAFGESAGAASVHYLMMSPMSRGLFHKAILQSGYAVSPWAFTEDPLSEAFELGRLLGCVTTDRRELYNFLLEVPCHKFAEAHVKLNDRLWKTDVLHLTCVPSVETGIDVKDVLLAKNPHALINDVANIPLMTGVNELEGLIFYLIAGNLRAMFYLNESFNMIPDDVKQLAQFPHHVQKIKQYYFKDKRIGEETFLPLTDLISDVAFTYQTYELIRPLIEKRKQKPVFLYKFVYDGQLNILKQMASMFYDYVELKGPCHADELNYLFNMDLGIDLDCKPEEEMIHSMCTYWSNFAKHSTPSPSKSNAKYVWQPTSVQNPMYLLIDSEMKMIRGDINEERMRFWNEMKKELKSSQKSVNSKL